MSNNFNRLPQVVSGILHVSRRCRNTGQPEHVLQRLGVVHNSGKEDEQNISEVWKLDPGTTQVLDPATNASNVFS